MQTQITARHFDASSTLKEYASDRLSKLERYYNGITDAHVILTNGSAAPADKHAEITLGVYRQRLASRRNGSTYEEAIDSCVANLRRQLMRYKAKLRDTSKEAHR